MWHSQGIKKEKEMVKKIYPIKWDKETGQWLLQYVTVAGGVQNVLSPAKVALENYLAELKEFRQNTTKRSH